MKVLALLLATVALTTLAAAAPCGTDDFVCTDFKHFCLGGEITRCAKGTHCETQPDDSTSPCVSHAANRRSLQGWHNPCAHRGRDSCLSDDVGCYQGEPIYCHHSDVCRMASVGRRQVPKCMPLRRPHPHHDDSPCNSSNEGTCLSTGMYCLGYRPTYCLSSTHCMLTIVDATEIATPSCIPW